jgi:serine protease Do
MRTFAVITVAFILVSCPFRTVSTGFASENWATEAYQKNCASVVFIQGDKVEERRRNTTDAERTFNGMGTGIIIDERGYIITNSHVVKDILEIQVITYDQKPLAGSAAPKPYIGTCVAIDADTDLAIIKINPRTPLRPITFGRSNDLKPGELCMAIGNPYGYAFSLTDGRISAVNREVGVNDSSLVYRNSIQTNTAINPGNSGGPLINEAGEMIGINVAIRQGAMGIAFAIPVDQVVEIAAKLIGGLADKQVVHGLTVSQVEPTNYDAVKRFAIRVDSVESNSPAAQAGIQKGDILTGIGQYTLRNKLDFYRALIGLKQNDDVAFSFLRNNELLEVAVGVRSPKGGTVVAVNRNVAPSPVPAVAVPKTAGPASTASNTMTNVEKTAEWDRLVWENMGVQFAPIPDQEYKRMYPQFTLAQNAEFPNGGVVVKSVRKGSPASEAHLETGDIIVGVNPLVAGLGPWEIASAENMWFVGSQEWTKLQSKTDSIKVDVIRENTHYSTDVLLR